MITIHTPKIEKRTNGNVRLVADITVDTLTAPLWVEVEPQYGEWLCQERSDGFLVGLLHFALEFQHDIVCETPVTQRLYEQLTEQFLPAYCKCSGTKNITITCDVASCVTIPVGGGAVGSGVSCGVDSMHVFATHPEITHGVVANLYSYNEINSEETIKALWENLQAQARAFTERVGIPLVCIDTNFDKGIIPGLKYGFRPTMAHLFTILALQKGFAKYIIASSYCIKDFKLNVSIEASPEFYEQYLVPLCSLPHCYIAIGGIDKYRLDKVRDILNFPPAKELLNVCVSVKTPGANCTGSCVKCIRTLLELHVLNAEEAFGRVFDIAYFHAHFRDFIKRYYQELRYGDTFMRELHAYHKRLMHELSFKDRLWVYQRHYWSVFEKSVKRIFRSSRKGTKK